MIYKILVDQDIQRKPSKLSSSTAVIKTLIFVELRNLNVYFKRHALSLTLDIYDLDKWQGGDIVIFKKHIGIVSNYRNKKGITFVIHHAYPHQLYYEEDILEKRNDHHWTLSHFLVPPLVVLLYFFTNSISDWF